MDKEEQREAIAGICGYTEEEPWLDGRRCWHLKGESKHVGHSEIPDYLNDLNAMHEAEQVLTEEQRKAYEYTLVGINRTASQVEDSAQLRYTRSSTYATAAQRAEAFLRVHGKWEEGK